MEITLWVLIIFGFLMMFPPAPKFMRMSWERHNLEDTIAWVLESANALVANEPSFSAYLAYMYFSWL